MNRTLDVEAVGKQHGPCSFCGATRMLIALDLIVGGRYRLDLNWLYCVACIKQRLDPEDAETVIKQAMHFNVGDDMRPTGGKYLTGLGTGQYTVGPNVDGAAAVYRCANV